MAVGQGFNAAVRMAVLEIVKGLTAMFQTVGSRYLVINPLPSDASIESQAMFRAAGWVFAWVIYHDMAGVGDFSPIMLMTLLCPTVHKFVISAELLRVFEPEGAEELSPWLSLGPKDPLAGTMAGNDKVRMMIIEAGGDVSTVHDSCWTPLLILESLQPEKVIAGREKDDTGEFHNSWTTQFLLSRFFGLGQGAAETLEALSSFRNLRLGLDVDLSKRGDAEKVTFIQVCLSGCA